MAREFDYNDPDLRSVMRSKALKREGTEKRAAQDIPIQPGESKTLAESSKRPRSHGHISIS